MPFGADTPTPEFVGNSRVRGARSPPGTHGDLTTPSQGTPRPGGWAHRPARRLRQSKVEKCTARPGFFTAKRRSAARRTFAEQNRKVCPAAVPGGGSVCPPGRQKTARPTKKNRVFSRPLRACIRRRGLLFRKKTVDFSAQQSDGCMRRVGNRPEGTAGPGGKSRRREKGDPHENPDLRHRDRNEPHHPPAGRAGGRGNPRRRSDLPAHGRCLRRLGGHRA